MDISSSVIRYFPPANDRAYEAGPLDDRSIADFRNRMQALGDAVSTPVSSEVRPDSSSRVIEVGSSIQTLNDAQVVIIPVEHI